MSAASALPMDPRSISTRAGVLTTRASGSKRTASQPGTASTAGAGKPAGLSTCPRIHSKSRSYPASRSARPTVGSTAPPVRYAARSEAPIAVASSGLTMTSAPARALRRDSSLSGRNRL